MAHCMGKLNRIYEKSNKKDGRYHHFQDTYQFRDFHTRRKIFRMEYWKLLLRNSNEAFIIYENTHHINSTRYHNIVKFK